MVYDGTKRIAVQGLGKGDKVKPTGVVSATMSGLATLEKLGATDAVVSSAFDGCDTDQRQAFCTAAIQVRWKPHMPFNQVFSLYLGCCSRLIPF